MHAVASLSTVECPILIAPEGTLVHCAVHTLSTEMELSLTDVHWLERYVPVVS